MTQIFRENGEVVPVTRVLAGPCQVTQVSTKGDITSLQIGFGITREKNLSKPEIGHLKDLDKVKNLREFKENSKEVENIKKGDILTVEMFETGQSAAVTGTSKGKGFQGVVKRHDFKGSPASHGHKDQLRMPGSIGAGGPQKVFKGTRMGGRMGGDQITVKNLEIVEINPETNEIYIKGAVPGARNGLVVIQAEGKLIVKPEKVDDFSAKKLAREIADKIQEELKYPGEIKVNLIRENRVIEYAK